MKTKLWRQSPCDVFEYLWIFKMAESMIHFIKIPSISRTKQYYTEIVKGYYIPIFPNMFLIKQITKQTFFVAKPLKRNLVFSIENEFVHERMSPHRKCLEKDNAKNSNIIFLWCPPHWRTFSYTPNIVRQFELAFYINVLWNYDSYDTNSRLVYYFHSICMSCLMIRSWKLGK